MNAVDRQQQTIQLQERYTVKYEWNQLLGVKPFFYIFVSID